MARVQSADLEMGQTLESMGAQRYAAKPMPLATNAEGEAAARRIAEAVAMARGQVEMRSLARAKVAADASAKAAADLHQMSDDLHQMQPNNPTAAVDAAVEAEAYAAVRRAAADAEASSDRVTAEATRAVAQAAADVQASADPAQMANAMAVAEAAMVAATTSTGGNSAAKIASYHSGDVQASAAALKTTVVPDTRPWYETHPIGDRLVEPKAAAALPSSVISSGKAMSASDAKAMKVQLAALQARKQRLRSAMEGFKYLANPSLDDTTRYKMAVAKFKQIDDKVKSAKGLMGITKDHADRFGSAKDQISLLAGVSPLSSDAHPAEAPGADPAAGVAGPGQGGRDRGCPGRCQGERGCRGQGQHEG